MKPIEAGCLAIIIFGEDSGKIVTVGKYLGDIPFYDKFQDMWEIDIPTSYSNPTEGSFYENFCPEQFLMRIDGGTFTEDKETMEIEQ